MNIFESLENLNVSEECFDEIMGIVETLVGKYKKEGKPVTSYSEHHGRNISDTDIKNEMKGDLYPKQSSKYLDKALKAQGEESRLIQKARDLDDVEFLRKITKAGNDREHNKQLADMYMRKAYATGKVTGEAEDNYNNKRQQIK